VKSFDEGDKHPYEFSRVVVHNDLFLMNLVFFSFFLIDHFPMILVFYVYHLKAYHDNKYLDLKVEDINQLLMAVIFQI